MSVIQPPAGPIPDGNPFATGRHGQVSDLLARYLDAVARRPDMLRAHAVATAMMRLGPGVRVLDAGCGTGAATAELVAAVLPDGSVVGVDVSPDFLAVARRRLDPTLPLRFQEGDVTALPFADGEFDVVRAERVLQHLDDPASAVAEMTRVLVPGGRLCVLDSEWASLAVDVGEEHVALVDRVIGHFLGESSHARTGRALRRTLRRGGLTDVDVQVVPFTFTSLADVAGIFPQFDETIPAEARLVPVADRDAWFAALHTADAAGELWVCALSYVACGSTPA
ncbi:MAG: methyltransferase domain-containing protein [Streptosporangiales bacterium]|nr:methyltransferase domain-containing protein [Streptosporangiales bacterium]